MISPVDAGLSVGRRRGLIATAAGVLVTVAALFSGLSVGGERALQGARDAVRATDAGGRVAVIEIDARSLATLDRWPWPRSLHARLVETADRLGADSIAFDVDFSARSNASEDARFAAALGAARRTVILPTFRQAAGHGAATELESLPLPEFRGHAMLAAVNVQPEPDGLVRRMPLGVVTAGTPRPSLPALVAGAKGTAGTSFPIDYAIDPDTIPSFSFADFIAGRVPAAAIAGRDLIVGATAIEMGDRYAVPGHGVIPGVLIQALAAETLMRAGPAVEIGWVPALLLAMLLIRLSFTRRRRSLRWLLPFAGVVALPLLALLLEMDGRVRMEIMPALILILAAGGAFAALGHLARLARERLVDRATGLPNLAGLLRDWPGAGGLQLCVAAIHRHQELAALLGPGRLDEVVERLAERLQAVAVDERIYRVEEGALAFIVAGWTADAADEGFEGLHALLRAPFFCAGRPVDLSVSFGIAADARQPAPVLIADALSAASEAASRGARWAAAGGVTDADKDWQLSMLSELDQAMADGSLWVAYQPKLDLASGRITGAEALVRWRHPTRGFVPPDNFIPQIEARGQILELTLHVLRRALDDAAGLAAAGTPINVAVNLSATLLGRAGLTDTILQALADARVAPDRLTLEVTESAAVELKGDIIDALEQLRDAGIRISVDDYGTGQSTMSYLKRFPAQELKIDKSFVQAMLASSSDQILVRSTIDMAHELGLKVVAEGVEDAATLAALSACGCDSIQGYHIGRPMPFDDLAALLRTEDTAERQVA
ncbi:EAL domain-containing protein (putative c-di-GMP-specific phosphodiesterase class I)/CHASE2 domain-containing sensor protein/GGDEF domain-containing protein [Sphingomonas jejuensis]|uniref:EAL domain-containing protein (Putative c-di-GMP-specific phosphodiesterase class I)/CHASE2 domain-containing sensor protein/GGDEF domain-containing protein n=1 Tax=Sphingomonas jejuensis TaxID=904715 RepID=A0ABX0XKW7_9SPHN|nr:EAL domain-containing protein [Sphingomonas jejuensis]NJC33502.1 EAL domain-containing protein (putative c-di-GMP-specific phosphodiesterase class I)/CHASE2 domain-containing sensor protein/GGDEF domain-containing protein [Sphingomonas jejuensis]